MQKNTAFAKRNFYSFLRTFSRTNILFIMRLSVCCGALLIFSSSLFASTSGFGQSIKETTVSMQVQRVSLKVALQKLQERSGYNIFYPSEKVEVYKDVSINSQSRTVAQTLDILLHGTELEYRQDGNNVIISEKKSEIKSVDDAKARRIIGMVVDATGQPFPGVTVRLKFDKETVTATDQNGHFQIDINNKNDVLIFSNIGFNTQEIPITNDMTSIRVVMMPAVGGLNEVVIIGYGASTRRDLTGAISSVTATDIAKQPVQDPLNALEGRVTGAVITQSSGLPGAGVNILIRGQNSLSAGTVPLYVIDGVPFNINDGSLPSNNSLNSNGLFGANLFISPFSVINPNDIERIDILKDADATAIYGARGGNGVVLITTKKGKAGKSKVDINLYSGIGKVARFIDVLNTQQYLQLRHQAITNDGLTPDPEDDPDLLVWDTTKDTNWQKKYLGGTAHLTDAQTSISGGNENTRFIFTNGFHRETTVYPGDYYDQRYTSRFNLDHNSNNRKFNMNLSADYSYDYALLPASDLSSTFNLPPDYPLYNSDGTLYWDSQGAFTNPQSYFLQTNSNRTNSLITNLQLRYTLFTGLDLKLNAGYNNISLAQAQQIPALSQSPAYGPPTNNANFANSSQSFYSVEPQITYTRKISKGVLSLLAGATLQRSSNQSTTIYAQGYSNPDLTATPAGASANQVYATDILYKFSSLFGRATYNWDGKYIVNGTLRTDGSSRFGSDHPFGTFYSVGGAWIFTKEDFFKNNLSFVSFGKLKGSFGITGNDQIGDYQYLPTYSTSNGSTKLYQGSSTLSLNGIPNPNLEWETDKKLDIGLDLGFLKDRILFSVDYYRNRSSNQLGYLTVAEQSGVNSYAGNLPALIQNRGFEFELNTTNVAGKSFTWKTSFNLTVPKSELLSVSPSYFYATDYVLGYPITQQRVYNFVGVDPQTGLPNFKAADGSITSNPNYSTDRTVIEDTSPKFYGGIGNDFTYGNFSFSFFIQYTKQTGIINPGRFYVPGVFSSFYGGNGYASQTNVWSGPGSTGKLPEATTQFYLYAFTYGQSNATYGDNSFVKLKNVSLSYKLPDAIVKTLGMDQLKIYAQGQNLYTWTKNKISFDPETGLSDFTGSAVMPPLRVITLGLNATF
jgi:TonB-linked SusC/RagA family outer membrane protein